MLAAAQQLSPFDRRRLDEHLSTCERCRSFYQDMAFLAGSLGTMTPNSDTAARGTKTLVIVPPSVSSPVDTEGRATKTPQSHRIQSRSIWTLIAASAACFACGLGAAHLLPEHTKAISKPPAIAASTGPGAQRNVYSSVSTANTSNAEKEGVLKNDLNRLQIQYNAVRAELEGLKQQDQEYTRTGQEREAELSKLRMENTTQFALINQMQVQLDQAHSTHAQDVKLIALRDDQVRQLTTNVVASSGEAIEDRKILEASKLMGQRNLHVVDVYDNNTKGQRTPSFGRVFYSEGGPMMFVAFDLPNHGAGDTTTYHAWGQMEGSSKKPLHLGTFTQDDATAKRWVMRVSDTRLLKQVDAVFITADHGTEVHAPSGLPLLYAYLRQSPNHP